METSTTDAVKPLSGTYGGLVPVMNNAAIEKEQTAAAEKSNNESVIVGLAGHVRTAFTAAKTAKLEVEQRMLSNLRARRGEYDPATLAKIKATGGSEVYMMISASKARSATAWLRDTIMGNGVEKPWTIRPTKEPELSQDLMDTAVRDAGEMVQQLQDMLGGPEMVPESQVQDILELSRSRAKREVQLTADAGMLKMESKMEDQLQEGGFARALYEFTDDISTFPAAILKGPVVRNKPQMTWKAGADGSYEPVVETALVLEWERVSPFDIYPSSGSRDINDGALIEMHRLRTEDLEALIGVEGYSDVAIKEVLKQHGMGGLKEWTAIATERVAAEGLSTTSLSDTSSPTISAVQYWGTVMGQHLVDWGMPEKQVEDKTKTYHCEVWVIGSWVIKATLNYDPFGRKPYYKAAWEELPGSFWGNSPVDLVADCQTVCNNAARALTNNMAISSGPQVDVNVDRVAQGSDITNIYPWKVHQTTSDPYGGSAPAISFFQPQSNANELMGIYEKFSLLADEYSGIPRYLGGDGAASGAGRTASGLSMLMGNAGKTIKSVIANIDMRVLSLAIERLFFYNMKHSKDPDIKRTDVKVVAHGAASLVVKEQAQVRRNEFLNIVLTSPVVAGIIGEEAVANLLRTMAAGLDMDTDKIIPPPEVIKARLFQQKQEAMQQRALAQRQATAGLDVPMEDMQISRDENGAMAGIRVMPGNANRQLQNGAPVTNNFTPARGM